MSVIWWIRRDLRLADNPTLQAALHHGTVIPIYILDPGLLKLECPRRQAFLFNGLKVLDDQLQQAGSRLVVCHGTPLSELTVLLSETGSKEIFAEEDYTPYAITRDREIAENLPVTYIQGQTVHHPDALLKSNGDPYTVFTPFSRYWRSLLTSSLPTSPAPLVLPMHNVRSIPLPERLPVAGFPSGEIEGLRRLSDFLAGPIYHYADQRNRVDLDGTSSLSPYIRFGMISMRYAVSSVMKAISEAQDGAAQKSAETWLNELIWREFYINILYHFPFVLRQSFRPNMRNIPWENDPHKLEAWKKGLTGYPIVDAGMRQLSQSGWMHNRARMIVASFLVKDLLIDWRWGERWFMQNLVDGDPAANNGGWQWTAGTGTDAAPYFRIFNPILQSQKFDPNGDYIRRWVPEIANLPTAFIHAPWETPVEIQSRAGIRIGKTYPAPIVEHKIARQRVLTLYNQGNDK